MKNKEVSRRDHRLSKEGKLTMIDFIIDERFQLNHYISYLFYQLTNNNYTERESL
jgi:hypothetical protein